MSIKNQDDVAKPAGTEEQGLNEEQRNTPEGRRRFVRNTLLASGFLAASSVLTNTGIRPAFAQVTTTPVPTTPAPTTTLKPTTTTTTTTTTTVAPTTTATPSRAIPIPALSVASLVALGAAIGSGVLIAHKKLDTQSGEDLVDSADADKPK